ncbi:YckD family protein [Clostridium swellfunianum]|uniref:YckD family protein n=1 Tax=Clostridium swellfunianum TaxID=1367462 RepID=UPI002030BE78|nr:YckD family protein [Clostridium swellfunianum]MCM0650689.1 YckD family protein [Clostridium swellfunianum]
MKKRSIVSALALTLAIGMGATAYAASADSTAASIPGQRLGLGRITAMRGYDYITNILKNKLGLSDEDITRAMNSGKTPYDIAAEKGLSQEQLKSALLEERTKAIDAAVSKGTITKEDAETLKKNLNENIENCTGNFGQRQGRGQGRGMMGNGQGRGYYAAPNMGTSN